MSPVKLYMVRVSPPCRIVWLYLLQNNIEHNIIDITSVDDLKDICEAEDFGGHTDVPILKDQEVIIFEAPAILEYLAKHYTNYAAFGETKQDQAKCSSLLSWTNSEVHRITGYMFIYPQYFDKYKLETEESNESLIESGIQQLTDLLTRIEAKYLKRSLYLCGSQVTIADYFLVTTLIQAEWVEFNFNMWPKVKEWFKSVKSQQQHWERVHEAHNQFIQEMKAVRHE